MALTTWRRPMPHLFAAWGIVKNGSESVSVRIVRKREACDAVGIYGLEKLFFRWNWATLSALSGSHCLRAWRDSLVGSFRIRRFARERPQPQ
jgi:hypothetical protein